MRRRISKRAAGCLAAAAAIALGGCQVETAATGVVNDNSASFRISNVEAVVGADGECQADVSIDPSLLQGRPRAVRPGMTECDLVRLQGRPEQVVIADLPDGRRRVEMFYPGSRGTTRGYVFVDNRLVSTPPGILKE